MKLLKEISSMHFICHLLRLSTQFHNDNWILCEVAVCSQITLSLNVRGVGRNLSSSEQTVGDRFLYLFLHSLGVILTSVQEAEIR